MTFVATSLSSGAAISKSWIVGAQSKRRLESALFCENTTLFFESWGWYKAKRKVQLMCFKWNRAQDKIKVRKTWWVLFNGLGMDLTYKTLEIFESHVFWIRCVTDLHNVHLGF